jgi:hypothetical protein
MNRKRALILTAAIVLPLSLIPVPYLASPEWSVQVVDESGNPLSGMLVRLSYTNYSVESTGHEENRYTDQSGAIIFPKHRRWASMLQRTFYTALSASAFAHASFGPHAYVFAFGNRREGDATSGEFVTDWPGKPERMESRIVATPMTK